MRVHLQGAGRLDLDWVAGGADHPGREPRRRSASTSTQETPDAGVHDEDRETGNYDMIFGVTAAAATCTRNFADPLDSEQHRRRSASSTLDQRDPLGGPRDRRAARRAQGRDDEDAQKEAVAGLAKIMMGEVPTIPLWYGAKWFQYSTKKADGWPNEDNPYADPATR